MSPSRGGGGFAAPAPVREPTVDTGDVGALPLPADGEGTGGTDCDRSDRGPGWAAECLRERTPAARITGIGNYDDTRGCVADWETIELRGHGFGSEPGTRQALLTTTRNLRTRVTDLEVLEWRDDLVRLEVPTWRVRRGTHYYVGLWTARGEMLAPPKGLRFCRRSATVRGTIALHNCDANMEDVVIHVAAGERTSTARVSAVPGNDFRWRYEGRVRLADDRAATGVRIRPELRGAACAGAWEPGEARVEVSHLVPEAQQDFRYSVEVREFRTRTSTLVGLLQSAFDGTEVRINNYAGRRVSGGSWHKAWDSYLELPDGLGGYKETFNIYEQRQGRRRYYVRDINLQDIEVGVADGAFELVFRFESGGPSELKGHCRVHGKAFGWRDCPVGSDKGAPDGQIDHMVWRIRLMPARYLGGLAYSDVEVDVEADIRAGGICTRSGGAAVTYSAGSPVPLPMDLCDIVTNYRDRIRNQAREQLTAILSRNQTRQRIADGLQPTLRSLGIGEVRDARLEGDWLVISHVPHTDASR